LDDQHTRLEESLAQRATQLTATEAEYRQMSSARRGIREKLEQGRDRQSEISALLERFALLNRHYSSDIQRLKAIEEAGTLFVALGQSPCPLCGAEPEHQRRDSDCDGNIDAVVAAARSETGKIEILRSELNETQQELSKEAAAFSRSLPRLEEKLRNLTEQIERHVSPRLAQTRASYSELADKRGEVREALAIFRSLQDMERRRIDLDQQPPDQAAGAISDGDLPATVAQIFAQEVEEILKKWHFPDADRVYFDAKSRDLIIAGKLRTARGKGLRAITHAAFTIGLLEFCRHKNVPHPGFVVLDSPLLAYRAPEGNEDDLRGTDLNEQFYAHLVTLPPQDQVIIVENTTPPQQIAQRSQSIMFSANPHSGRYGLFPIVNLSGVPPS
jgi:hypothetical protein